MSSLSFFRFEGSVTARQARFKRRSDTMIEPCTAIDQDPERSS
jgi:hypothetical protein